MMILAPQVGASICLHRPKPLHQPVIKKRHTRAQVIKIMSSRQLKMCTRDRQHVDDGKSCQVLSLVSHLTKHLIKTGRKGISYFRRQLFEIKADFLRQAPHCKPVGYAGENAIFDIDKLEHPLHSGDVLFAQGNRLAPTFTTLQPWLGKVRSFRHNF